MNRRRLIGVVAGAVLLIVGVVGVLLYSSSADKRALEGLNPQTVLVAQTVIPRGTTAESLATMVRPETLPGKAVVATAVTSLDQVAGQVANTDIQPGEQILRPRFVDPTTLGAVSGVKVPAGYQQLTITLENQRVFGGRIIAGNKVGVFISKGDNADASTHLVLNQVLVTDIRGGGAAAGGDEGAPQAADAAPTLTVTFAVKGPDAERLVWAQTNGTLWLSLQGPDNDASGTRVVNGGNVLG